MGLFQRILVPVDGSATSQARRVAEGAVKWQADLVRSPPPNLKGARS